MQSFKTVAFKKAKRKSFKFEPSSSAESETMRYRPDRSETLCKDKSFCKLVSRGLCDKHPSCKRGPRCSFLVKRQCTFYHPREDWDALREEGSRSGRRSRSRQVSPDSPHRQCSYSRSRSRSRSRDRGFSRSPGRRRNTGKRIPVSTPWSEREERELVRYCAKHRIDGDWIPENNFHEIRDRFNREINDIRAALLRLRVRGTLRMSNRGSHRPWTRQEEDDLVRYAEHHRLGDWLTPERTRKISKEFDRELKDIKSKLLMLRAQGRLRQTKREQIVQNQNPWREWEDQWLIEFVHKWRIQEMFTEEHVKQVKYHLKRTLTDIKTHLFKLRHEGRIANFDLSPRGAEHPVPYEPPLYVGPPPLQSMAAPIDMPFEHHGHVQGQIYGQGQPPQTHPYSAYPPTQHPTQYPQNTEAQIAPNHVLTAALSMVPPPPPPRPKKVLDPRDPRKRVENEQGAANNTATEAQPAAPVAHGHSYPHQLAEHHTQNGFGNNQSVHVEVPVVPDAVNGESRLLQHHSPPNLTYAVSSNNDVLSPSAVEGQDVEMKSQQNEDGAPVTVVEHHKALMHGSDYSVSEGNTHIIEQQPHHQRQTKNITAGAVMEEVKDKEVPRTEEEEKAHRRALDIHSLSLSLEKELERGRQLLTHMKPPNDKNGQKEYIKLLRRQIECLKRSNFEMFKYQNQRNQMEKAKSRGAT